ncbi:hypothetical protein STEG23_006713, partial [Scotinomys teguina]
MGMITSEEKSEDLEHVMRHSYGNLVGHMEEPKKVFVIAVGKLANEETGLQELKWYVIDGVLQKKLNLLVTVHQRRKQSK